jgi:hypothetical protein
MACLGETVGRRSSLEAVPALCPLCPQMLRSDVEPCPLSAINGHRARSCRGDGYTGAQMLEANFTRQQGPSRAGAHCWMTWMPMPPSYAPNALPPVAEEQRDRGR